MRTASILTCVLLAGCGKVERAMDSGPGDRGGDGAVIIADASPPDATPVACDGPEDCMNPADPCLLPGACEDSVCHFEAMDCSDLDGECTTGICRDGACQPKSVREDQGCGSGVMACGGFGGCGGFDGDCDESGTESRSCTDSTCQAGECVTSAPYTDSRGCARETDGNGCGDSTEECDGICNYTSTCDNDDTDVNCVVTDYVCAAGACDSVESGYTEDCRRDTEGLPCGSDGCCSPSGVCFPDCV